MSAWAGGAGSGAAGRERGEHRDAERPADLLRGVEHAGDHARVGVGGARHAEGGHGGQRQPAAEAEERRAAAAGEVA